MRWLLILPLIVACDRVRPPAPAEKAAVPVPAPAPVIAAAPAPDTAPVVALQSMPDSAAVPAPAPAPDSVVAVVPDSAPAAKSESAAVAKPEAVVRPRALIIPASLAQLPPDPENEALDFDGVGAPVLPYVSHGDCEGARCSTGFVALACVATNLRSDARIDAPIAARLPAGELIQVRRDLHMVEAGVVLVKQDYDLEWDETPTAEVARGDTVHLAQGDTIFVLRSAARGQWTWTYRGRVHDSGEFWSTTTRRGVRRMESDIAVRRSLPRREQWWSVKRIDGTTGWWLQSVSGEREETEAHDELQQVTRNGADACAKGKKRV